MITPESPQVNNPEYLSQEGIKRLEKELDELKNLRRQEIAERLEYAKSLGDLSENTEYESAKEEQLMNESRIAELDDILSRAVIIKKEHSVNVQLGSTVSVKREGSEGTEKYSIVGPEEADSLGGKISHESPLGRSLLGKKKGENIEVLTPNGKINYTIIDVG